MTDWPSHWTRARLGDVADVNWGDTSVTKAAYVSSGYTAFSASGPDGFLPYFDFDRVGVVLSAIGADSGKTWLARGQWSCIKNTIRFWSTRPDVDTAFLYWITSDPEIWPKRGSAQPFISQGDARAVEIAYPDIVEQRRIAHMLGALDDRIELNQRVSATLEATAQALFASRFVDDLFGSTTGEIAFGQVAELVRELIDPQASPELLIDHYSLPAFDSGREPVRERGRAVKSVKTLVPSGSVLVSKLNPAIDRVWLADPSPGVVSVSSTEFLVLMPRAPVGRAFLYCLARSDLFRRGLIELATGTSNSHQRVATASMMEILVPEPDASEAGRFEAVAGPLLLRSAAARRESRSLREIRDALLPRLLSGAPTSGPARARALELSTRSA